MLTKRITTLLVLKTLLISSCSHISPPEDVKVYRASKEDAGIVRNQDKEFISCVDKRFNDFICVSEQDFQYILTCPHR